MPHNQSVQTVRTVRAVPTVRSTSGRHTGSLAFAGLAFLFSGALTLQAQPPQQTPPAGGRGAATPRRQDYPQRPPGDPAAVERGKALYGVNCQFCHGADTRGGDGGPSLLRTATVLDDQAGELVGPVVKNGRADRGMPKFSLSDSQVVDIAAFIHSFTAAGYDASRMTPASIVVGDAKVGASYFSAKCGSCHSATGDLKGFAEKFEDPKMLQQTWMVPGSAGRARTPASVKVPPTTVTVTLTSGETIEGELDRLDDFVVSLSQTDGTYRSFRTNGDSPKVVVHDPLQPHKDLLRAYSDADIHNVTAFLMTLK
jgi:cytochrome c oxidase cbb3-type subunit III